MAQTVKQLKWENSDEVAVKYALYYKTDSQGNPVSIQSIADALAALPTPMVFKGSVGTNGTIGWSSLPTPSASNDGWTYVVITDHSTAPVCQVGDTIISNGTSWVVVPSGDEPSGTVTSVAVQMNGVVKGVITTSGTIDLGTVITEHQSLTDYVKKTTSSTQVITMSAQGAPLTLKSYESDISYIGFQDVSGNLGALGLLVDSSDDLRAFYTDGTSDYELATMDDLANIALPITATDIII